MHFHGMDIEDADVCVKNFPCMIFFPFPFPAFSALIFFSPTFPVGGGKTWTAFLFRHFNYPYPYTLKYTGIPFISILSITSAQLCASEPFSCSVLFLDSGLIFCYGQFFLLFSPHPLWSGWEEKRGGNPSGKLVSWAIVGVSVVQQLLGFFFLFTLFSSFSNPLCMPNAYCLCISNMPTESCNQVWHMRFILIQQEGVLSHPTVQWNKYSFYT